MKTFNELRKLDVSEHVEKKGGLSYISWTYAVDTLLQNDPAATWKFNEPKMYGETMMVSCDVTAFGKTMNMHLPVMDNRNSSVKNPDSRKVSDAMMRCLCKCIATFGIGLYIYAGEDLPEGEEKEVTDEEYKIPFGKYEGQTFDQVGISYLDSYIDYLERQAKEQNKPAAGKGKELIERANRWIEKKHNEDVNI